MRQISFTPHTSTPTARSIRGTRRSTVPPRRRSSSVNGAAPRRISILGGPWRDACARWVWAGPRGVGSIIRRWSANPERRSTNPPNSANWCAPSYNAEKNERDSAFQKRPDRPCRLTYSLIVLDERESHMSFAHRPEADAGRHRHQSLLQQQLGKLQRSHGAKLFRNWRPQEHRSTRLLHAPACAFEPGHQDIAPPLVHRADLLRVFLALAQRDNAGDLNRLKHAVIEIALDPRQRRDHLRITQAETHAPTRHVVALR